VNLVTLAFAVAAIPAQGPTSDTLAWPREVERVVQQHLQRDGGALWRERLDTVPLFLVAGKRVFTTADPKDSGFVAVGNGWWSGALPSDVVPSNTALAWANRRWAMMRLPLPADTFDAARLVVHERWHVIQPAVLPLPKYNQFDPGAALLDRPEGRTWLRLEWLALATALEARPGSVAERRAVSAALTFRARRYAFATAAERERERLLDLDEGMPEYSAWKLTKSSTAELAKLLREAAPATPAYGRAFQYFTGPAYGLLLDRRASGWRTRVRSTLDLQSLLAQTVRSPGPPFAGWLRADSDSAGLARRAAMEGARFGLAGIEATEVERWVVMQRQLADLRARFIDGPTVRLRPEQVSVGMNPNRATSLGDAGTVYGDLTWKGANGAELSAPAGGLVNGSWSEIRVPLDSVRLEGGVLAQLTRWSGAGWSLTLPAGWRVEASGSSWTLSPPR
jgi:hypothetical protein